VLDLPILHPDWPREKVLLMNHILIFDKLDLFGSGLIAALLYHNRSRYAAFFKGIFRPWMQVLMAIMAVLYMLSIIKPDNVWYLLFCDHYVCGLLFGYVLLSAVAENSVFRLENPLLTTLGRVSFGIYLFHTAICQLVLLAFIKVVRHPEWRILYDVVYPFVCLAATGLVAYLSYNYYEMWFLRKKKRFELVTTRV
jgi:peptidoglycan/LPS O-acetylase OafA/YrhL